MSAATRRVVLGTRLAKAAMAIDPSDLRKVNMDKVRKAMDYIDSNRSNKVQAAKDAVGKFDLGSSEINLLALSTRLKPHDFKNASVRTARAADPASLKKILGDAAEGILSARVKVRKAQESLDALLKDSFGVDYTDNYNNPKVKALRDELYELDQNLGVFHHVESFSARTLPTLIKKDK